MTKWKVVEESEQEKILEKDGSRVEAEQVLETDGSYVEFVLYHNGEEYEEEAGTLLRALNRADEIIENN